MVILFLRLRVSHCFLSNDIELSIVHRSVLVGADLGVLLTLIHDTLKKESRLAIAQKDYKPLSNSSLSLRFICDHESASRTWSRSIGIIAW